MMTKKDATHRHSEEWRWRIVQARDKEFDGAFFFGVNSTKIYCKPSCAARRAKRENTMFFATPQDAEDAGFRACLRCHPRDGNVKNPMLETIVQACVIIENNNGGDISLDVLGAQLNVSPSHLQRAFKRALGMSPKEYRDAQRLENFKTQARKTDVTTALYESGFGSSRALYESATRKLGMTPATYRKGGKGMKINFTTADSSFGKLLVAATRDGVCAVSFGVTDEELASNLTKEFPAAEIKREDEVLQNYVLAIVQHLDGAQKTLELPLDLQATAFQRRVWTELRRIPYGETRSYKEIAGALGNAKAVRAVARACATNRLAVLTPCHRVVREDGNLSGYRWGVERKERLLAHEKRLK